jgi:hypothetical protein
MLYGAICGLIIGTYNSVAPISEMYQAGWVNIPSEYVTSVTIKFLTNILGGVFWFWLVTVLRNWWVRR